LLSSAQEIPTSDIRAFQIRQGVFIWVEKNQLGDCVQFHLEVKI